MAPHSANRNGTSPSAAAHIQQQLNDGIATSPSQDEVHTSIEDNVDSYPTSNSPATPAEPYILAEDGPVGCYLTFEATLGGRLVLLYSKGPIPSNALGFFCPGKNRTIQGFKFKQGGGRVELIKGIAGGDQNRRKYYSGWCQFIKLAKAMDGYVIKFGKPEQGVDVDIICYKTDLQQPVELDLDEGLIAVGEFDAVAVIPKHKPTFRGMKTIVKTNFLELGGLAGASTTL